MHKQQADVKGGLTSGIVNSGPNKMNEMRGFQKQLNLTSSLQDIALLPDVQNVRSESQIIKREPGSQGNDTADVIQLDSGDLKCYRQGMGDTAGSSTAQRNLSKSTYVPVYCEQSKSETILMHTVVEHPNSLPGDAKICTSFSGTTSTPCELPQLMDKEPSSTGNTVRLAKKELVSPIDIKHESAKFSEESSQQVTRCSEKVQPKSSIASAPKPYQESRIYTPTVKPRLPVSKEQLQKATTTGDTPAKSYHEEVPLLQSRNKAAGSSSSQRKDKIHQRIIHVTQEASNNSTSTELRASDLTASLSDEQLALLLHQQLNSSPRVPRVPRCHQAAGSQMLHTTGASVFSKRSSGHGGRDNATVLKKRNREDTLKGTEDTRTENASFVDRRHKYSSAEHVPSVKDSCRSGENIALEQRNHGVCSTGANTVLTKDDSMDTSVSRNLPGLIDGIISKNRSITHEELCVAVHQHFRDMRKPGEEDPSFLHAINDCLRKRREWAHLVGQAPKTNSNKRRKGESDSLSDDVLQAENMRPKRNLEEGSADLHQEDLPRGKRKARKHRRLELKGRRVRDTRKRSNIDSSSEGAGATLSDSSSDRNDTTMEGMDAVNQEDSCIAP